MTTTPILCNKNQVLHGDAAAMLLDMLTSTILGMLVITRVSRQWPCQSDTDDNIPASTPCGTKVKIGCHAVAISQRMANLYGAIKTTEGKACVICVHDLVVLEGTKL